MNSEERCDEMTMEGHGGAIDSGGELELAARLTSEFIPTERVDERPLSSVSEERLWNCREVHLKRGGKHRLESAVVELVEEINLRLGPAWVTLLCDIDITGAFIRFNLEGLLNFLGYRELRRRQSILAAIVFSLDHRLCWCDGDLRSSRCSHPTAPPQWSLA